jgi:hypothetical protein
VEVGNNNEIILSTGTVSDSLNIIGVKDNKNFYCLEKKDNKNIFIFNTEKQTKTLLRSSVSPNKYIKAISFNNDWMVWTEDEVEVEKDTTIEKDWNTYAQNLKTGELIDVDKYKNIKLDPDSIYKALEPKEISIYDDKVVYDTYDVLENGTTCAVIKMYDLNSKNMQIIDANQNYKNGFYGHPKIFDNFIVWSLSQCNLSDYFEKGSTYIYDIKNKQKKLITTVDEILWPYIYGDYIVARVKPRGQNENSSLVLFDLNRKKEWTTVS